MSEPIEMEGLNAFSGSADISLIEALGFFANCCRIVGF